jgi:hypothetical protein
MNFPYQSTGDSNGSTNNPNQTEDTTLLGVQFPNNQASFSDPGPSLEVEREHARHTMDYLVGVVMSGFESSPTPARYAQNFQSVVIPPDQSFNGPPNPAGPATATTSESSHRYWCVLCTNVIFFTTRGSLNRHVQDKHLPITTRRCKGTHGMGDCLFVTTRRDKMTAHINQNLYHQADVADMNSNAIIDCPHCGEMFDGWQSWFYHVAESGRNMH